MRPDDPNRPYLIIVAEALGELREEVVFVGGCAAGLLITDPAAESIRATKDVDAIVEAATLVDYYRIEQRLSLLGFMQDTTGDVVCRWKHRGSGVLFDLMPDDPSVLGFSNTWYPETLRTATRIEIRSGLDIRLISPAAFLATKLEAFASRGRNDYLARHDLEDVLNVIDGRPSIVEELAVASGELKGFISERIGRLVENADFRESLPGLVAGSSRAEVLMN